MEEKCKSTMKGEVPVNNEELNAKTETKDVLISDLKEEKIEGVESSYEFVERSNPPHQGEGMAKEQKAEKGEELNYAKKAMRDEEDKEEITKDGEKVSNKEKKECHDELSKKLEEHEETKGEEKSREIVDGKEKGNEEKKEKDEKEEEKKKLKADEEEEEDDEKKQKDKKEKKKKKDKKCSESGEGTEAEDTEKEEKKKKKKDKKKKEEKHMDKTSEGKRGGDDSKEDEEKTEGCPDVLSREVTVEEDLGKSEGQAEKKKGGKHQEQEEKKEKDKDKGGKKKECVKDKYKDIGRLKYKLEKINGKIEALLEKKAFIFGKLKEAEAKNGEASEKPAPKEVGAADGPQCSVTNVT